LPFIAEYCNKCVFLRPNKSPTMFGGAKMIIMNRIVNQKITWSIGIRTDKQKRNRKYDIHLFLHLDNKRAGRKNINIEVSIEKWNKNAQEISNPKGADINFNQYIRQIKNAADKVKSEYLLNGNVLTWDLFIAEVFDTGASKDFYHYWEKVANRKTAITKKSYLKNMSYIKKFAPTANFSHVNNATFINDLRFFLQNKYTSDKVVGLAQSTINKCIDQLKAVLSEAKNDNVIGEIQINNIRRLPVPETEKIYLRCDELKSLIEYYNTYQFISDRARDSFRAFLFCCFTALRHGDVRNLKYGHIRNGSWDNFNETKTMKKRRDKIFDMAFEFIDKPTKENQNDYVFDMLCEQQTRRVVKKVIEDFNKKNEALQLDAKMKFHSSKKTCANLVGHFSQNYEYAKFKSGHTLDGVTFQYYLEIANTQIEIDTNAKINEYFERI